MYFLWIRIVYIIYQSMSAHRQLQWEVYKKKQANQGARVILYNVTTPQTPYLHEHQLTITAEKLSAEKPNMLVLNYHNPSSVVKRCYRDIYIGDASSM